MLIFFKLVSIKVSFTLSFTYHLQLTTLALDPSSDPGLVMFTGSLLNATVAAVYPNDLPVLIDLFQESIQYIDNNNPITVQVKH